MNSLVLITAITATSGLFGGHKSSCGGGGCGRATMARHHTYAAPAPTCYTGSCTSYAAPTMQYGAPGMTAPAPQASPGMPAPPAPPKSAAAAPAMAPATYYVQSYYYTPASPCANGQCYRR